MSNIFFYPLAVSHIFMSFGGCICLSLFQLNSQEQLQCSPRAYLNLIAYMFVCVCLEIKALE